MSKAVKTARLSIISNSFLILLKTMAGIISGSVSIISEAIHSLMDLFAAVIAFFSIKVSNKPPDKSHPYGHSKYENILGVIEALLIFMAAIWIIYEAVKKIIDNEPVETLGLGFGVMFVSAFVNFIVSRRLYKVAKETDSIALEADALHLKTDVYTSLGVGVGLFLIWLTKLYFLDPVIAILVALIILQESFNLLKKTFSPLLDHSLAKDEEKLIKSIIEKHISNFHQFRTRKAGKNKFVDFHIKMPENITLKKAHDLCDEIEKNIKKEIENIEVTIHVETSEYKRN